MGFTGHREFLLGLEPRSLGNHAGAGWMDSGPSLCHHEGLLGATGLSEAVPSVKESEDQMPSVHREPSGTSELCQ